MAYLGIDVGTSAIKVVLIDESQFCLGQSSVNIEISRPHSLWSEQNPATWWDATCSAIDAIALDNQAAFKNMKAIGITGQMHGATCLDKNSQVLRPAILWNDGRSYAECDILNKHPADFAHINGNVVMPGFTAPKLLWLQKHEPELFKKIHKVLLPKDFIRFKLSGDYATDLSDASGTSWLDVGGRCWSEPLLAATNLGLEHMPKVYEGTEVTGELKTELADRWQMPRNVKIVAGAGDNAAGAISLGIVNHERAMLSLGTSGVYFVPNTKFASDTTKGFHTFCHCIPNTWHQMGVILSAAVCLNWWRNVVAKESEKQLVASIRRDKLKNVPIFLPYLSGERTPHNDPFAQGVFFGMTHDTGQAEITQAVLEGVAFAVLDCQEVLQEVGTVVEHISVIGGGAKNKYWGEILATVLNKPLSYHNENSLGPSFGAARLAMIGDLQIPVTHITKLPTTKYIIQPDVSKYYFYQQKFFKYRKIYKQLRELFKITT